ncbi:hypothetical protein ABIA85_008496 [Bradyrhizobium sp. LA6.10]|uniref:ImmA/IrrE family metallo-endopeptidase n=1 Tax=Bradyrhizobium sp. LA6.10 TaxID=3156318 RepID=UPI0033992385
MVFPAGGRAVLVALRALRWAIDISLVLNAVLGKDRFPVDVALVAREYSTQRYPDDSVSLVVGRSRPGFDGALYRAPAGKRGWGIFYNSAIASTGRINFTLGHEFGHYLIHRLAYPDGLQCGEQDVVRWDSEDGQIEHQANVFSAGLLTPLDDFRRQIPERDKVDLDSRAASRPSGVDPSRSIMSRSPEALARGPRRHCMPASLSLSRVRVPS